MALQGTWWSRVKAWLAARKVRLITSGLLASLGILLLWPSVVISIYPGEVGVLYSRLFGGTVMDKIYGEGMHLIFPWDTMYIYNTRLQQASVELPVLSRGGLSVNMQVTAYFYPLPKRLPELQKEIGPDYKQKLVMPIINASIRNVVGGYWPEDLYTSEPLKLQDEIMVQAVEQMARKPVIIDSLVIRCISLPQNVNNAIDLKFSQEQDYLRYKYVVLKAGEQLKKNYIDAESVRLYEEIINRGLTENFLRWSGIEATKALAASANAKIVIVGGRDGLPLILNTESPAATAPNLGAEISPAPAHRPAPGTTPSRSQAAAPTQDETLNPNFFADRIRDIQKMLNKYSTLQNRVNEKSNSLSLDLPKER